jgi:hypothetical protein
MIGTTTAARSQRNARQPIAVGAAEDQRSSEGITPFLPDWIVPLQLEGAGRPVFVFPAADNEPMALVTEAKIAAHVGGDRPFWAFARNASQYDLVHDHGVPALAAEYVAQIRALQGNGPFLLYGTCIGGYFAWETARQLLDAGEEIAGMLFNEVPLRPDFATVLPGHPPVRNSKNLWRLSHYFQFPPLPVDLTYVMTESWQARGWWEPWQDVVGGTFQTAVLPNLTLGTEAFLAQRDDLIAGHAREWIGRAEGAWTGSVSATPDA